MQLNLLEHDKSIPFKRGARMNRKMGEYYIDGFTVEYSIVGQGRPVLVFHGGHSNCQEEFGYEALVDSGFSVITPSRAGYGTTSPEIGTSLSTACYYYAKLLDHLNIDNAHVIAISAGGPTGIYFAAHFHEYTRSLVLQSAVTKEWLTPKDIEYKAANVLFHPKTEKYTWKLLSSFSNTFPNFMFKQMLPSFSKLSYKEVKDKMGENDVEAIRKMNNRQRSGYGFEIDLQQINELSVRDLHAVSCPTLIMHSKHDRSVSLDHAYFAKENIPMAELQLLDAWGHLIWLGESGGETDRMVIAFLKRGRVC